jgi:hypothetical protein
LEVKILVFFQALKRLKREQPSLKNFYGFSSENVKRSEFHGRTFALFPSNPGEGEGREKLLRCLFSMPYSY